MTRGRVTPDKHDTALKERLTVQLEVRGRIQAGISGLIALHGYIMAVLLTTSFSYVNLRTGFIAAALGTPQDFGFRVFGFRV